LSTVRLATQTLAAIDAALQADNGARYRGLLKEEFAQLSDAFATKEDTGFRTHLGASLIGKPCARELWYSFHWSKRSAFSGRIIRLFNRGHLEEARFLALLRLIGCETWSIDDNGNQLRFSACDGHFGGSLDGIAMKIPDAPLIPHLVEFKTHSAKSFAGLSEGVRSAKFEHYVQMQCYMHAYNLTEALYLAVNKDTDDLHAELITYERAVAERYLLRAQAIIDAPEPPTRLSDKPSWYQCKFCDYAPLCHTFDHPETSCRTCAHSTPAKEATWDCALNREIPKTCAACENHIYNPTMLNKITITAATPTWMEYTTADGRMFTSGKK
jgi:hypothetical protein